MTRTRRSFLTGTAALAATATLWPRGARAFGTFPSGQAGLALPEAARAKNVLEVFLYGGLSPWETFYFVESYGAPGSAYPGTQLYTFAGGGPGSLEASLTRCGLDDGSPLGEVYADDADGVPVALGPYLRPLRARPDLVGRLRVLVNQHDLEPHEAAIPFALTGKRLGAPALAGLGAHVQRYFAERDFEAGADRKAPYSYVFTTGGLSSDNVLAATATGAHPGSARPLAINVADAARLTDLLSRPGVMAPDAHDALLDVWAAQLGGRLTHPSSTSRLRSPSHDELLAAARSVRGAPELLSLLPSSLLEPVAGNVCTDQNDLNAPAMSLRLAARLLNDEAAPAKYVCVVDTGLLEAAGGGGYDTHEAHARDTARNLLNLQQQLFSVLRAPGDPPSPDTLDPAETLVILNTEFGRTPTAQDGGSGRNHHPYGYTTVLLGGPATPGLVGAIGEDGFATSAVLPSESRIAALLALGIFPFSAEAFGLSDVQGAGTEPGAIADVTERVLGVTS